MQRSPSTADPASPPPPLEEMLELQLPAVRRYVQRRMGTKLRLRESASDIVQSVCREVLQDAHQAEALVRGEEELRQWLLLTAARKLVNRARYNQAEKRQPTGAIVSLEAMAYEAQVKRPGSRECESPDSAVVLSEEMDRLRQALDQLPDEYRQVFEWRHVHGFSRPEIAELLGKTPNAVSKLLARATARLARRLRDPSAPESLSR